MLRASLSGTSGIISLSCFFRNSIICCHSDCAISKKPTFQHSRCFYRYIFRHLFLFAGVVEDTVHLDLALKWPSSGLVSHQLEVGSLHPRTLASKFRGSSLAVVTQEATRRCWCRCCPVWPHRPIAPSHNIWSWKVVKKKIRRKMTESWQIIIMKDMSKSAGIWQAQWK